MRKFALILLCLVTLAAGWFAVQWLTRPPLTGERNHHFGRIAMQFGAEIPLQHTFRLVNRTGEKITINAVKPDCGCVSVGEFARSVEPGAEFLLPVTMKFGGPSRTVPIMMDLGDLGVESLRVSAESTYLPELRCTPNPIPLSNSQPTIATISANIFNSFEPAAPSLTTSAGVQAQWHGWKLKWKSSDPNSVPTQWVGELAVHDAAGALPKDAHVTIQLEPAPPLRIEVTDASATPNPATAPGSPQASVPVAR